MFKMLNKNIFLKLIFVLGLNSQILSSDIDFIESFIKHYEFNAEGRYAHEYHPALLNKTSLSLDQLEQELSSKNFNLKGRIIICGYEENAIPSYYTDFKKAKINDEASSKNKVGWSLKLHNRFGFMTGFLFKDFNFFSENWYKDQSKIFEHLDSDDIEIFDDRADIFQKHAFGQALDLLLPAQKNIIDKYYKKDFKGILQELSKFWKCMYGTQIKFGDKQKAGTQDILFSIEYANHLNRSNLDLINFFVGPDLTYPIEVSLSQPKEATIHAQNFVKRFSQDLIVYNNQPTVYVFCSFVDGVGKSTMLGNIKNFSKYSSNIDRYERVDNSSSQLAEIYKLKENIFIADLPAQVSHFTYKPDGYVYVNVESEKEFDSNYIEDLRSFVRLNKDLLKSNYEDLLKNSSVDQENYIDSPEKVFIKNLFLLKKEKDNRWIPFNYKDKYYLYNFYDINFIRVLVPLGSVQSEGLKNIESEQMLFFDGIKLPLPYDSFLQDLVKKLKNNNIKNIIFVDFISMYPRSSRENVRINYLLQQISFLDNSFDPKFSLYRDFVNEAELFSILKNKDSRIKILTAFELETLIRLALFKIILNKKEINITGYSVKDLTNLIKEEINKISVQDLNSLKILVNKKLETEYIKLEELYGLDKSFVNIEQISFDYIYKFSEYLINFFNNNIKNERLNVLWQDPGTVLDYSVCDNGLLNKVFDTDKKININALYSFDKECRDEILLTDFIRTLRSNWYAALSNLIDLQEQDTGFENYNLLKEKFYVIPHFLKMGNNNKFYLITRLFSAWGEAEKDINKEYREICDFFSLYKTGDIKWVEFGQKPYRLDWRSLGTNSGLFSFDCNIDKYNSEFGEQFSLVSLIVKKYQKDMGYNNVMPTSFLWEKLENSCMWKYEWQDMLYQAKRNRDLENKKNKNTENKNKNREETLDNFNKIKIKFGTKEQMPAARLFVKTLATLEMILKDPKQNVVIRPGNMQDFKAGLKLIEKIILPKYFGIIFTQDLFQDYDLVEPVV